MRIYFRDTHENNHKQWSAHKSSVSWKTLILTKFYAIRPFFSESRGDSESSRFETHLAMICSQIFYPSFLGHTLDKPEWQGRRLDLAAPDGLNHGALPLRLQQSQHPPKCSHTPCAAPSWPWGQTGTCCPYWRRGEGTLYVGGANAPL